MFTALEDFTVCSLPGSYGILGWIKILPRLLRHLDFFSVSFKGLLTHKIYHQLNTRKLLNPVNINFDCRIWFLSFHDS